MDLDRLTAKQRARLELERAIIYYGKRQVTLGHVTRKLDAYAGAMEAQPVAVCTCAVREQPSCECAPATTPPPRS